MKLIMRLYSGGRRGRAKWIVRAPNVRDAQFPPEARMQEILRTITGISDATLELELETRRACIIDTPAGLTMNQRLRFLAAIRDELGIPAL